MYLYFWFQCKSNTQILGCPKVLCWIRAQNHPRLKWNYFRPWDSFWILKHSTVVLLLSIHLLNRNSYTSHFKIHISSTASTLTVTFAITAIKCTLDICMWTNSFKSLPWFSTSVCSYWQSFHSRVMVSGITGTARAEVPPQVGRCRRFPPCSQCVMLIWEATGSHSVTGSQQQNTSCVNVCIQTM